jgi:hypothetical protein
MFSTREIAEKTDHNSNFNGWGKYKADYCNVIDYIYPILSVMEY